MLTMATATELGATSASVASRGRPVGVAVRVDTALTLLRRLRRRENVFAAHRSHSTRTWSSRVLATAQSPLGYTVLAAIGCVIAWRCWQTGRFRLAIAFVLLLAPRYSCSRSGVSAPALLAVQWRARSCDQQQNGIFGRISAESPRHQASLRRSSGRRDDVLSFVLSCAISSIRCGRFLICSIIRASSGHRCWSGCQSTITLGSIDGSGATRARAS